MESVLNIFIKVWNIDIQVLDVHPKCQIIMLRNFAHQSPSPFYGEMSTKNYFKFASSSFNKIDPPLVENSSTSTNENVSLLPSEKNIFTLQLSTSCNEEICVSETIRNAINSTEDHPSIYKNNKNSIILHFDESSTAASQP